MNLTKQSKNALIGLGVFILYFIYSSCQLIPLQLLGINYNQMTLTSKVIYLLLYEFIFIIILFLIYRKKFTNDFKKYIKKFKTYIMEYMEYWALAFGLMIISNMVITGILPDSVATNQEILNSTFDKSPLYMIISACLFAPFIEETIFRLSIRNMFKNDTLFIIISGFIFGSLHVIGSSTRWMDLAYFIPYSIPGFIFAYTLVKSKNIFVPMSLHLFHNSLMIFIQIISTFLI